MFGFLGLTVVGALLFLGGRSPEGGPGSGDAVDFTLQSTAGGTVSLSDYGGRDVLLYFNEGVGCDACFYQTLELERNMGKLQGAGITVLPIVMNPAMDTSRELGRFGLSTPYLIDPDGSITRAYGMMGKGMHANLPGHGFVLVDGSGQVRWKMEYPSMFVSSDDLLSAIDPYLT